MEPVQMTVTPLEMIAAALPIAELESAALRPASVSKKNASLRPIKPAGQKPVKTPTFAGLTLVIIPKTYQKTVLIFIPNAC
jgi:hypothetical protein